MFGRYKEVFTARDTRGRQAAVEALNRFDIPFEMMSDDAGSGMGYGAFSMDSVRTVFRVKKQDLDRARGVLADCMP